jgi:hypothetical protein
LVYGWWRRTGNGKDKYGGSSPFDKLRVRMTTVLGGLMTFIGKLYGAL